MMTAWLQRQPAILQRLLAIMLFIAVASIVVDGVVEFGPKLLHLQAEWRVKVRKQLAASRAWVQSEEALTKQAAAMKQASVWTQFYAAKENAPVAAQVQQDVTSILNSLGLTTVALDKPISSDLQTIHVDGVKLTVNLTVDQLRLVCAALHSHVPYLRLQRLQVLSPQTETHYENPPMAVTMEIAGFSRIERDTPPTENKT